MGKQSLWLKLFFISSMLLASHMAIAGGGIVLSGIAFTNPALLANVENNILKGSLAAINTDIHISGLNLGIPGATENQKPWVYLPDAQMASRLSDHFVWDVNITHPLAAESVYPRDSFVSHESTTTKIRATNIGTDLSFQIPDKLAVGAGVYAQYLKAEFDAMVFIPPLGDNEFINRGKSVGVGWQVGLLYKLFTATYINASYFSKVSHHLEGPSSYPPFPTTSVSLNSQLPAMLNVEIDQAFSRRCLVSLGAYYTFWEALQNFTLTNTALAPVLAPVIIIPLNFDNTLFTYLNGQYQINERWWVSGFVGYDKNTSTTNSVRFPSKSTFDVGVGTSYEIVKNIEATLNFTHAFARHVPITPTATLTNTTAVTQGNVISLKLAWKFGSHPGKPRAFISDPNAGEFLEDKAEPVVG